MLCPNLWVSLVTGGAHLPSISPINCSLLPQLVSSADMSVSCSSSVTHGELSLEGLGGGPPCPVNQMSLSLSLGSSSHLEPGQLQGLKTCGVRPHDTPFSKVHSSGDKGIMHMIIFSILIVQSAVFKILVLSQAVGGPQSSAISCVPSK